MADDHSTLIAFVPGFRLSSGAVEVRGIIKCEGRCFLWDRLRGKPEERSFAGYPGVRFTTTEGRTIDIAEVGWEPANAKLSAQPAVDRIRFFLNLLLKVPKRFLAVSRGHGLRWLSVIVTAIVILWAYVVATAIVAVVEKSVNDAGATASLQHLFGPLWPWCIHPLAVAFSTHGWWSIAALLLIAALGWMGLDTNTFVDVTDAYERYLNDQTAFGSALRFRAVLVQTVIDAVRAIDKAGPDDECCPDGKPKRRYDRVVLIGHSFGTLLAADAAPQCGRALELITVGGLFEYLKIVNREGVRPIIDALRSSQVTRWEDFYSHDDLLSARVPVNGAPPNYHSRSVRLHNVGIFDRMVTRAHIFYFTRPEVLSEMFNGSSAATPLPSPP